MSPQLYLLFRLVPDHVTTHLVGRASMMIAGALPTGLAATVVLIIGFSTQCSASHCVRQYY